MTQFEERLSKDREEIRLAVVDLGLRVSAGIQSATTALLNDDRELAAQTMLMDHPVNRLAEDIDKECHHFVARHLPSAGHLRFISSVLRMTIALERIGDYAVTIAREISILDSPIASPLRENVEKMAGHSIDMLEKSIQAFQNEDNELALETMRLAKKVDDDFAGNFKSLVAQGETGRSSTKDIIGKLTIVNMLERVSDQAKNLCEYTVFWLTGETKQRRPVNVLFVDKKYGIAAKMAAAIGAKAYPNAGRYRFLGNEDSETIANFIEKVRLDVKPEMEMHGDIAWKDFDVVVSLDVPVDEHIAERPFRTIATTWSIPELDQDLSRSDVLDTLYRRLSDSTFTLMETLRGKGVFDDD